MKRKTKKIILLLSLFALLPVFAFAQQNGLVPCNGPDCNFGHVGDLIENVIKFIITRVYPVVFTISIVYAGILMLTAAGNTNKVAKAKAIVKALIYGLVIMLSAWLVVYTLLKTLGADRFIS